MGKGYKPHASDMNSSYDATNARQKKALDKQEALTSSMDFITGAVSKAPRVEDQLSHKQQGAQLQVSMLDRKGKPFPQSIYMSNNLRANARGKADGKESGMNSRH